MRCVTFQRYLVALAWVVFLVADSAAESPARELPGIRHFFRVTTNVFSGSQPEGGAAFAALSGLGVKTLVSVDGAKPDVELAAKHGLRYVHLPIGYDGIPTNRVAELSKAGRVTSSQALDRYRGVLSEAEQVHPRMAERLRR